MALDINNDSKNNLSITNQDKGGSGLTWDEATFTWDEGASATWDNPGIPITKESKNSLTVNNEAKN